MRIQTNDEVPMKYAIADANGWTTTLMISIGVATLCAPFVLWSYAPDDFQSFVIALAICASVAAPFIWLAIAQSRAEVRLTDSGLQLTIPWYGRHIDYTQIDVQGITTVDLNSDTPLRPRWRSNGVGLPGLRLGWFRTRDKRKALLAVTQSKVIAIPTHDGYVLIASVASPQALADAIRKRALTSA
jgi:hypothetical protein